MTDLVFRLVRNYLREAKLMQLATVADGKPWVCSVWFAADEDLRLYWFSSTTRRHSAEVAETPAVAGAIAYPAEPGGPARGLSFEGTGRLLTEKADVARARSHYAGRIFSDAQIDAFMANPESPHRFYEVRPTRYVLFDTVNFPENSRRELLIEQT